MDLEDNTWEVFKHVRDFALKIIQWKSNCYFFETCIREHLRIKGLRVKDNKSFNDPELRSRRREHYLLAERKVTHENYEFAKKRKKEVYQEFSKWKAELFKVAEIDKSKDLWNTVKTEITRNNRRKMDTKDKKLGKLREERRCTDTTLIDSLDLDIGIENSRKELRVFRKRNGGKNRRSRKAMAKELRKLTIEGEGKKERTIQKFYF